MCAFKSIEEQKEEFEVAVYDAICTPEGCRCADGREFSAFHFDTDAENESDLLDSAIDRAFNACMDHICSIASTSCYDESDYELTLDDLV